MTDQYLMEKNGGQMNVKPDKLEKFLAEGWVVVKTPQENKQPPVVEQEIPEEPEVSDEPEVEEAVSVETAVKTIGKKGRKARSK